LIRVLPVLIELGLLIYCLIDCIQTPEGEVRNLPKMAWILLIVVLPVIGGIAWLFAGRPPGQRGIAQRPSARSAGGVPDVNRRSAQAPKGPDDDPEFLRQMRAGNAEQDDLLRRWEEDLRRRERQLRPPDDEDPPAT
jgi:hypothetical protein